jgi:hypothetical protein
MDLKAKENHMEIYARQGDLVITKLAKPSTADLAKKTNLVLACSDTSPHTVRGVVLAAQSGQMWTIRVERKTEIVHGSRHFATKLVPGDYEIRPLRERGGAMDRAVED